MLGQLKKRLQNAEGRSEFVIAVICDIRGFSSFSTCHESPDTAMFIKRFYLKLLEEYFTDAIFAKPTGDGLLLIFTYSELDLNDVSNNVLNTCIKVMEDFPTMFADDSMINFKTPRNVGFGISRGPACCLFSGKTIIDYSGRLLNLAARLNDLARPKGIVIDGHYLFDVIPKGLRKRFRKNKVYLRGIAEEDAIEIFCLHPSVSIPSHALFPISAETWKSFSYEMQVSKLGKLSSRFALDMPAEPISPEKIKLELQIPNKATPGYSYLYDLEFDYYSDGYGYHILFNLSAAKIIIKEAGLTSRDKVVFQVQYIPKRKSKKRSKRN